MLKNKLKHLARGSMKDESAANKPRGDRSRGKGGNDSRLRSEEQRRRPGAKEDKPVSMKRKGSFLSKKMSSSFESPPSQSIQPPVLNSSPPPPPSPSYRRNFLSSFNGRMRRAHTIRSKDDCTSDNQSELNFPKLDDHTVSIHYSGDDDQPEDVEVWRINSSRQQLPRLKPRIGAKKNPFGDLSQVLR